MNEIDFFELMGIHTCFLYNMNFNRFRLFENVIINSYFDVTLLI